MNNRFLFPHPYKRIGWIILVPSLILGLTVQVTDFKFAFLEAEWLSGIEMYKWSDGNFTNELACIGIIVGFLFASFSKEKVEDEQIARVRMESLQWSVYLNYIILALMVLLVHGTSFLLVMIYNMFTIFIFFLARFHFILNRQNSQKEDMI